MTSPPPHWRGHTPRGDADQLGQEVDQVAVPRRVEEHQGVGGVGQHRQVAAGVQPAHPRMRRPIHLAGAAVGGGIWLPKVAK